MKVLGWLFFHTVLLWHAWTKSQPNNMNQNVCTVIVSGIAIESFHMAHTRFTEYPYLILHMAEKCWKFVYSHLNLIYFFFCQCYWNRYGVLLDMFFYASQNTFFIHSFFFVFHCIEYEKIDTGVFDVIEFYVLVFIYNDEVKKEHISIEQKVLG